MKHAPAPQGVLVVITAIFTFVAGLFRARGEVSPAIAILAVLVCTPS